MQDFSVNGHTFVFNLFYFLIAIISPEITKALICGLNEKMILSRCEGGFTFTQCATTSLSCINDEG